MVLEHHNTPLSGLSVSSAQILMSRQLRSTLPTTLSNLQPQCVYVRGEKLIEQQITKYFYDRTSKSDHMFKESDNVLYRSNHQWHPEIIWKTYSPRSYLLQIPGCSVLRRNSVYIKPSKVKQTPVLKEHHSTRLDKPVEQYKESVSVLPTSRLFNG